MRDEQVDCAGCKAACCRRELVALIKGDRLSDYPDAIEFNRDGKAYLRSMLPDAIGWVLPQSDDGACVYLKDNQCSIYDKRPQMCRAFSCVGWVKRILETTTRAERRQDKDFIDTEVWREGKKRMRRAA